MLNVFISYSHNEVDRRLLSELRGHMAPLVKAKKIIIWEDAQIPPGGDWDINIKQNIDSSDIVLLLISNKYNESEYINQVEIPKAMNRQKSGKCVVVPILLRDCYFKDMDYAHLEILPKQPDSQKLVAVENWNNQDAALLNVVNRLDFLIEEINIQCAAMPNKKTEDYSINNDIWERFFQKNPLKNDLGLSITVNCDRQKHYVEGLSLKFRTHRRESRNFVFFLSACNHQKPVSLAKRLIYELIDKGQKVAYFRDAKDSQEAVEADLKIGFEPENSWAETWKIVQQKLASDAETPEDICLKDKFMEKDWIVLVFRVTEKQWDEPDLENHISFIIGKFATLPEACRKYIIFFVSDLKFVHSTRLYRCKRALDKINGLKFNMPENAVESMYIEHYDRFRPVALDHIRIWFDDIVIKTDKNGHRTLFNNLKYLLAEEDRNCLEIDMEIVETMQEFAYKYLTRSRSDLHF